MSTLRRLTTTALALGALATGLVLGPVGAASAAAPRQATTAQATTPTNVKPLASSPGISPGTTTYHTSNGSPSCPAYNLCAVVWDWSTSSWKVFQMNACYKYTVSNWLGGGVLINAQQPYGTSATTAHLYNGSGGEIGTGYPARAQTYSVNWDPVGAVRNCS